MQRITTAPGIDIEVSVHGHPDAPAVLLLHGFPESAYSWRHQIQPLVDAGYRVIAPNQRGYGESSNPHNVEAYTAEQLTADAAAILDALDVEQAHIVGHDWGALVAWHMGFFQPGRCRSITGVSVPFYTPQGQPTQRFTESRGDRFFYINYFQTPDVPEQELDSDPERFLRSILWAASGDGATSSLDSDLPALGTTATQAFEAVFGGPREDLPPWLSNDDLHHYVAQFKGSGFHGPVNWYRNFDQNYFDTKDRPLSQFSMPTAFIAGSLDPVIADRQWLEPQKRLLPDFRDCSLIEGAGHWVQQESPTAFTRQLLATLHLLG